MLILTQNRQRVINVSEMSSLSIRWHDDRMPSIEVESGGVRYTLGSYTSREIESILREIFECSAERYEMPLSTWYSAGRYLTDGEINKMRENFIILPHAKERIKERNFFDDLSTIQTDNDWHNAILPFIKKDVCAFYNRDGQIIIAIDEYKYFVFEYSYSKKAYALITYVSFNKNGTTVFDKQRFAASGRIA